MTRPIWTQDVRKVLYAQLLKRFGPLSSWEAGTANGSAYKTFCSEFAKVVGAKSGKAVRQQVFFTFPIAGRSHWDQGHASTAVSNLAAALEVGFIAQGEVPSLIASNNTRALFDAVQHNPKTPTRTNFERSRYDARRAVGDCIQNLKNL